MPPPRARAVVSLLLPWLAAKRAFKPSVGPSPRERRLDRLAFWRAMLGLITVVIATHGHRQFLAVLAEVTMKTYDTLQYALALPPPAFLAVFLLTRRDRRRTLWPRVRRYLIRGVPGLLVLLMPFLLSLLYLWLNDGDGTIPGSAVGLREILIFIWAACFYGCTLYWATRTGLWISAMHPLLAPVGSTLVMLVVSGQELIGLETDGVPSWLWLTLNLGGVASSLTLAVMEYRLLHRMGYRWREGPDPVTGPESRLSRTTGAPSEQTILSSTSSPSSGSNSTFASWSGPGSTESTL